MNTFLRERAAVEQHVPVMLEETLELLAPIAGGFYVDGTFGRGGHTARILQAVGPSGSVLALDRDPAAIAHGRQRFASDPRLELVHGEFAELAAIVAAYARGRAVQGVLLDLGVSSPQLDQAERGFSFSKDGPLDMRMDPSSGESAAEYLQRVGQEELQRVIAELGEERFAKRIAAAIVTARNEAPILRTRQLAAIVERTVRTRDGKHPATRSFQALRMQVNDELGQIRRALVAAVEQLAVGGRLVVISFHSLEDRLVKRFMRQLSSVDPVYAGLPLIPAAAQPVLEEIGRKRKASAVEVERNPRARSAVLRGAMKLREPATQSAGRRA